MSKRLTALAIVAFVAAFTTQSYASINVKFQVHMGVQMILGNFNPTTDSVLIRGDFQTMAGDSITWGGTMFTMAASVANDSIYELTVPFNDTAATKWINYKYVIRHLGNDTWESLANNRTDSITTASSQSIPLVYFNNQASAGVTHYITFQADMTSLQSQGFNDATDSIMVRGDTSPLNWGPGIRMTKTLLNPHVYSVKLQFTAPVAGTINYKFWCGGSDNFSNTGWEGGGNVALSMVDKDTVYAPRVPDITIVNSTTGPVLVKFVVDMTGAVERYHGTTITGLKSVWIGGGVLPLNWPSNWNFADTTIVGDTTHYLQRLYDDGTHGDSVAGDNKWTDTLTFGTGVAQYVEFKFGAIFDGVDTLNGGASYLDNEAGFALNHSVLLVGPSMTVYHTFGDQVTAVQKNPNGTEVPSSYSLSQNYPNPFNPTTQINYTVPKNSFVTLKVYNVLGQEIATLFSGKQSAGSYIATFDATRFASGVYFFRMQAGTFSSVKKMVLMK